MDESDADERDFLTAGYSVASRLDQVTVGTARGIAESMATSGGAAAPEFAEAAYAVYPSDSTGSPRREGFFWRCRGET
jgi:hypothetical protein